MARTFSKPIMFTEHGRGLDRQTIASIVDHFNENGKYPEYLTQEDANEIRIKYIIPYNNELENLQNVL